MTQHKADGYHSIQEVGGTALNPDVNLEDIFPPHPIHSQENSILVDFDGDGVQEELEIGPVEMPSLGPTNNSPFPFQGAQMPPQVDPDKIAFQKCDEWAQENGLVAVMVKPDPGQNMLMTYPEVVYLNPDGSLADPELTKDAPNVGFGNISSTCVNEDYPYMLSDINIDPDILAQITSDLSYLTGKLTIDSGCFRPVTGDAPTNCIGFSPDAAKWTAVTGADHGSQQSPTWPNLLKNNQ